MTAATLNTYGVSIPLADWQRDPIGCAARVRGEARRQGAREYEVEVAGRVVKRGKV